MATASPSVSVQAGSQDDAVHLLRHARRAARLAALLALSVYLFTAGGSLATIDAVKTFEVTRSLVERGAIDAPPALLLPANRGVDGRYYPQFGIGQSLYGVPFYLAGRLVERVADGHLPKRDVLRKAAVASGSAFAAAGCVWLAFLFATWLSNSVTAGVFAALSLAFGTLMWPYSKFGFNAPLATLCLLGATALLWAGTRRGRRSALLGSGFLLAALILVRHEGMLAAVPAAMWLAMEAKGPGRIGVLLRRSVLVGAPYLAGVGFWLSFNVYRFGSPFYSGYTPRFGNPLVGLQGLLLSPGGSLFLYCPLALAAIGALVWLARRDRASACLLGGNVVVFLLFYSTLVDWQGGRSYGPRYLVPTLPFLCIAVAAWYASGSRRLKAALLALTVVSVIVQWPGVLVDFSKVGEQDAQHTGESHAVRAASWHSAAIVLNTSAAVSALPLNAQILAGTRPRTAIQATRDEDPSFARSLAFSLDFWWVYAYHLRLVRAPIALLCGLIPLVFAAFFAVRLRAAIRPSLNGD